MNVDMKKRVMEAAASNQVYEYAINNTKTCFNILPDAMKGRVQDPAKQNSRKTMKYEPQKLKPYE